MTSSSGCAIAKPVRANSSSSAHHSSLGSLPKSPPAPLAAASGASSATLLTNRVPCCRGRWIQDNSTGGVCPFRVARRDATAGVGVGLGPCGPASGRIRRPQHEQARSVRSRPARRRASVPRIWRLGVRIPRGAHNAPGQRPGAACFATPLMDCARLGWTASAPRSPAWCPSSATAWTHSGPGTTCACCASRSTGCGAGSGRVCSASATPAPCPHRRGRHQPGRARRRRRRQPARPALREGTLSTRHLVRVQLRAFADAGRPVGQPAPSRTASCPRCSTAGGGRPTGRAPAARPLPVPAGRPGPPDQPLHPPGARAAPDAAGPRPRPVSAAPPPGGNP